MPGERELYPVGILLIARIRRARAVNEHVKAVVPGLERGRVAPDRVKVAKIGHAIADGAVTGAGSNQAPCRGGSGAVCRQQVHDRTPPGQGRGGGKAKSGGRTRHNHHAAGERRSFIGGELGQQAGAHTEAGPRETADKAGFQHGIREPARCRVQPTEAC